MTAHENLVQAIYNHEENRQERVTDYTIKDLRSKSLSELIAILESMDDCQGMRESRKQSYWF
jgi:DNA-binding response OmpR family regulator